MLERHRSAQSISGQLLALENPYMGGDAFGQPIESIAAFEYRHDTSLTQFVGKIHNHPRNGGEALRRYVEDAETVVAHGVKASADQNEVGFEGARGWDQLGLECLKNLFVACARTQRYVQDVSC